MGIIYSALCMISFCFERVLTWACCACAIMALLSGIMLLMVYGISIGYGYAQQELAGFAKKSREHLTNVWMKDPTKGPQFPPTPWRRRRRSGGNSSAADPRPSGLAAAENKAPFERTKPLYEVQPSRNYRDTDVPPEAPDARDALEAPYVPQEAPEAQQEPEALEAQMDPEAPDSREAPGAQEPQDVPDTPDTERITYIPVTEAKPTPFIILPTERPPEEPEMLPHEKELARSIIGRFRRSKYVTNIPKSHAVRIK